MKGSETRYYKSVSNKRVDQEFFALGPDSSGVGYHVITLESRQLSKGDNLGEVHNIRKDEFLAGLELFSMRIQMTTEDIEDTKEVEDPIAVKRFDPLTAFSLIHPKLNKPIDGFSTKPLDELIYFMEFSIENNRRIKVLNVDGEVSTLIPHSILKDCLIEFEVI